MKKVVGFVLAIAGLAGLAVTSLPALSQKYLSGLPAVIQMKYLVVASLMLVIFGVILSFDKHSGGGKTKLAAEEVPIYAGEGKHKRIVGYKRAS